MAQVLFVVGTPALYTLWRSVVEREQLAGNIAFAPRPYVSDTPDPKEQRLLVRADLCRLTLADRVIFLNIGGNVPSDFLPLIAWCLHTGIRFEWLEEELGATWLAAHEDELMERHVPSVPDLERDPLHQPKAPDPPPKVRVPPPPREEKPAKIRPPAAVGGKIPRRGEGEATRTIVSHPPETLPAGTMVRRSDGSVVKTKQVAHLMRARDTWARDEIEHGATLVYVCGNGEDGSIWFYPSESQRTG